MQTFCNQTLSIYLANLKISYTFLVKIALIFRNYFIKGGKSISSRLKTIIILLFSQTTVFNNKKKEKTSFGPRASILMNL